MAMEEEEEIEEYATSETNFEKYIGENLFGKIGILIFIIGIGFFVKYAIDQNWINETARTLMGYAVGAGMLVLAERLHKRYHTFSSLLAGGAFGIYYLITAIAFHYYALFSHTIAFVILCVTTIFMSQSPSYTIGRNWQSQHSLAALLHLSLLVRTQVVSLAYRFILPY